MKITSDVFWVILSVLIKLFYGLIVFKLVTLTYGIEYLGRLGQLFSITAILLLLSNGGINRGVVQYYAKNIGSNRKIRDIELAIFKINIVIGLVLLTTLIAFNRQLSELVFSTASYGFVFIGLAVSQLFMGFNNSYGSILIAQSQSKRLAQSNVSAIIFLCCISYVVSTQMNFENLLYLLIFQSIVQTVAIVFFLGRKIRYTVKEVVSYSQASEVSYLLKFALGTIFPVLFIQLALMVNRKTIGEEFGLFNQGLWEAVIKLQEGYLQIVITLLVYFYLPRASKGIDQAINLSKKYKVYFTLSIFIVFVIVVTLGEYILYVAYSEDVVQANRFLTTLVIGDVMRVAYIINQYYLLSIGSVKAFIVFELMAAFSSILYVSASASIGNFDYLFQGYVLQSILLLLISYAYAKSGRVHV